MFKECRHIKPGGNKCKAPALRDKAYCYYHDALHRVRNPSVTDDTQPIDLPSLEDQSGVQIALHQVLRALSTSRIDPRRAGLFLRGLQIAVRLAAKPDSESRAQSVRDLSCDDHGNPLAPEETRCEPPQDCPVCERRNRCQSFRFNQLKAELQDRETEEFEDNQD